MANVYATKSGNWSDTTVWNTSTLPATVDNVWSNNFTVYVNGNFQVVSIRNKAAAGITIGGRFVLNDGVSLSANVEGGGTSGVVNSCLQFLSAAPASATLYGNLSSNNTAILVPGAVYHNGSGILTIYGNLLGGVNNAGNANSGIITNNSTGTLTMFGSVTGGTGAVLGFYGINNNSSGTVNISGNVTAGVPSGGNTNCQGLRNLSTGTVNITGNVTGTTNNSDGILCGGAGTVNVLGNVIAGSNNLAHGINNSSTGTVNIVGSVLGGTGATVYGVNNNSTGNITVSGNAIGGTGTTAYGVYNNAAGVVIINGNVIANTGDRSYGAFNNATGYMQIRGTAVGNGWGLGSSGVGAAAPGIFGSQTGTTIIQGLSCGPRGQWPTAGNVFILPANTSTATLFTSASAAQVLFTSLSANITPPVSSVKLGTKYNLNDYTGTCAIPSVSSVLEGVAVDNSIGVAALQPQTVWSVQTSAMDTNLLGGRLKDVSTVQSFGQLLTAFNM
jgi:hypothetical protein